MAAAGMVGVGVVDTRSARRDIARMIKEEPAIARSVLNATANKAIGKARKEMAAELGVPLKAMRKRMTRYSEKRGVVKVRLWTGLKASIKASELGRRHLRTLMKHGTSDGKPFKATMPNGHTGLYMRVPGRKRRTRLVGASVREDGQRTWLPIKEASIAIPRGRAVAILTSNGREQMRVYLPKELKRRINVAIKRRAAKR